MEISAAGLEELEREAARSWRAPEEEHLGDWLLRAGGGFTGRANSALAAGAPGLPLDEAAEAVRRWYSARGLPPMVAVPYPVDRPEASPVDRFLAGQGWTVRSGAATVMTIGLAGEGLPGGPEPRVADGPGAGEPAGPAAGEPGGPGGVRVGTEPDDGWLALYHYRGQDRLPPIARTLLMSAAWQGFGSIRAGGRAVAIGRVAGAPGERGHWAGLTAIEVDPGYRRRGLASAITAGLAAYAARQGATGLYLQVDDTNEAARALYRRAGFAEHHGYHYRVAP